MNEQKMIESLQNAAQDQAFVEAAANAETAESFTALLKEKGVLVDDASAAQLFHELSIQDKDELSEEDLDNVSGGGAGWIFAGFVAAGIGIFHGFRKKK